VKIKIHNVMRVDTASGTALDIFGSASRVASDLKDKTSKFCLIGEGRRE